MGVRNGDAGQTVQGSGGRFPERDERGVSLPLIGLAAGITAAIVAWGYLVWLAIDLGRQARTGDSAAWGLLAVACLGAVACLFVGLLLLARLADAWRGSDETALEAGPGVDSVADSGIGAPSPVSTEVRPAPDLSRLVAAPPVEAARTNGFSATLPIAVPEPPAEIAAPEPATATPDQAAEIAPEPVAARAEAAAEPAAEVPAATTAALPALTLPLGTPAGAVAEPATEPSPTEPATAVRTPYPGAGKRSSGRHAAPAEESPAAVVPPGVAGKRRANV